MEMNSLINLLTLGYNQIKELEAQLDLPSSAEACRSLVRQVESAFSAAITMAKLLEQESSPQKPRTRPAADSHRREVSGKGFKEQDRKEMNKKRRTLPRWSNRVRMSSGSAMEATVDDGHSWRKYGQKDILGSKFPRGYYRCTYRHSHGCQATKQVQRSDEDPSVFDISYRGTHTCNHGLLQNTRSPPKDQTLLPNLQETPPPQSTPATAAATPQELLQVLRNGLTVNTECLSSDDQQLESFPSSFSFSLIPENHALSLASKNCSPTFMSTVMTATSSESNYSLFPCNYGSGQQNFHGFESEIAEIMSAAASSTSSPTVGMKFELEHFEFDDEFPFDFC